MLKRMNQKEFNAFMYRRQEDFDEETRELEEYFIGFFRDKEYEEWLAGLI